MLRNQARLGVRIPATLVKPRSMNNVQLSFAEGIKIQVPDSLHLITPYVLLEQQDWFEDEISFVRRVLSAGGKAIDIGANFGVYTLSMAQCVGPKGSVWAYEPASSTADALSASVALNGFSQVSVERCAVSSAPGKAQLQLQDNAELNALVRDATSVGRTETVPLVTLDDEMKRHDWAGLDFIKIDAEGEELGIIQGAHRFLAELSPLVQFEIRDDTTVKLDVVAAFMALGYEPYRLVPGLQVLVPFDPAADHDPFLLNLFACKPDRADRLAERAHLIRRVEAPTEPLARHQWAASLAPLPYAAAFGALWAEGAPDAAVVRALAWHAMSGDATLSVAQRHGALMAALAAWRELVAQSPVGMRRASLARVANEAGARSAAAQALTGLVDHILSTQELNVSEPFLAPSVRFASLSAASAPSQWVLGGLLEALEQSSAFSSFYTGQGALQRLKLIQQMGFASEQMLRRLQLIQARFP
ncbi:MAG: hypothetical protein RJB60_814 [Pseudomonadota bacterium]